MANDRPSDSVVRAAPAVTLVCCMVALAAHAVWNHLPMVVFDGWTVVPLLQHASEHGPDRAFFGELLTPHVSHCHATGQLLIVCSAFLTGFDPLAEVILILCIALAYTRLFQRVLRSVGGGTVGTGLVLGILAPLVLLAPDQGLNWVWGWQLSVHCALLGVATCAAGLAQPKLGVSSLAVAMVGAACAMTSSSIGFLLGPLGGLWILAHQDARVRRRVTASCLWILLSGLGTWAFVSNLQIGGAGGSTTDPLDVVWFAAAVLGTPVARQEQTVLPFVPVLGIAVASACVFRLRGGGVSRQFLLLSVFLILVGAGAAILTAGGRVHLGHQQARTFRYVGYSNLFWLGALMPVAACLGRAVLDASGWRRLLRLPVVLPGFWLVLLVLGKVGGCGASIREMSRFAAQIGSARAAIVAQVDSGKPIRDVQRDVLETVGDPSQHEEIVDSLEWLRSMGWEPFDAAPEPDGRGGEEGR